MSCYTAPETKPAKPLDQREGFRRNVAKALDILESLLPENAANETDAQRFRTIVRDLQGIESNIWRTHTLRQL